MIKADVLSDKAIKDIKASAFSKYPEEACGLIVKKKSKYISIACENTATNKRNNFLISSEEFSAAEDIGEVVAVWHSHVEKDSSPSEIDVASCNASEMTWFIVDIYKEDGAFVAKTFNVIQPKEYSHKYLERPYIYGVNDCFSLAKKYYENEFGLKINVFPPGYPEVEHDSVGNLLLEESLKCGFELISNRSELKVGDLLLSNLNSQHPNHISVYIGDSRIMHHCKYRLSETHIYPKSFWEKHTTYLLRHPEIKHG